MDGGEWIEGPVHAGPTTFWVRQLGDGDDLVLLLHGWPEDGTMWRRVAPGLAELGHRVACPDLKGFGRSDTPTSGYDLDTLAAEIADLVEALGVQQAVLVGHDWGGIVAMATALRHPERVRSLVVASAPHGDIDLRRAWHVPLLNVPVAPELAFRTAAVPLLRQAFGHAAVVQEPFTDEVIAQYAASVAVRPSAWLSYYRSLSRRMARDRALGVARRFLPLPGDHDRTPDRVRVPGLVLWGDEDPVLPVRLAVGVARDLGAELQTFPGIGHFLPEEAPDAFVRAVAARIGGSPSTGGTGDAD